MNPKVDQFLEAQQHPLTAEIQLVRAIILATSDKVEEDVKGGSPTFMYKGHIASFSMNAEKQVALMFHQGALIPDPHGVLEGDGEETRMLRFDDMADIHAKKDALVGIIRAWIKLQDGE